MRYLLAVVALLPFAALAVAMIRGRVRVRPCCPADATADLRMHP